jgi:hypothetical protein
MVIIREEVLEKDKLYLNPGLILVHERAIDN